MPAPAPHTTPTIRRAATGRTRGSEQLVSQLGKGAAMKRKLDIRGATRGHAGSLRAVVTLAIALARFHIRRCQNNIGGQSKRARQNAQALSLLAAADEERRVVVAAQVGGRPQPAHLRGELRALVLGARVCIQHGCHAVQARGARGQLGDLGVEVRKHAHAHELCARSVVRGGAARRRRAVSAPLDRRELQPRQRLRARRPPAARRVERVEHIGERPDLVDRRVVVASHLVEQLLVLVRRGLKRGLLRADRALDPLERQPAPVDAPQPHGRALRSARVVHAEHAWSRRLEREARTLDGVLHHLLGGLRAQDERGETASISTICVSNSAAMAPAQSGVLWSADSYAATAASMQRRFSAGIGSLIAGAAVGGSGSAGGANSRTAGELPPEEVYPSPSVRLLRPHANIQLHVTHANILLQPCDAPDGHPDSAWLCVERASAQIRLLDAGSAREEVARAAAAAKDYSTQRVYGVVGVLKLLAGPYLALISAVEPVGRVLGCAVLQVVGVLLVPFTAADGGGLSAEQARSERQYVAELQAWLQSGAFFFSYCLDLTRPLQDSLTQARAPSRARRGSGPAQSGGVAEEREIRAQPLWKRADHRFFFNWHASRELTGAGLHAWALPLIQGYIQVERISEAQLYASTPIGNFAGFGGNSSNIQ
ncbi:SacI homology domain-containing protein [Pavlovales sp. CCMP2436]|nr:SacI homology domain-containing protein [Pavlovales sp. CCMP2436]